MQADFAALHTATRQQLASLVRSVAIGAVTPAGFGDQALALLQDAHTDAVVIGRQHAGLLGLEYAADRAFAAGVVAEEESFLQGFVEDLQGDRYQTEDGFDVAAAERRAGLYADRLTGTANEAWAYALPAETRFTWELGAEDGSCDECPARAAGGPYTWGELPGHPGDNSTPCLFNCRCQLVTDTGQSGFTLPE